MLGLSRVVNVLINEFVMHALKLRSVVANKDGLHAVVVKAHEVVYAGLLRFLASRRLSQQSTAKSVF